MILTSMVLAGALGTGTLGIKAYREEKKKKEYPWAYAAEKMARKNGLALRWKEAKRPLLLPSRTKKKPSLLLDGVLLVPVSRRLSEGMLSTKASLTRVKEQLVKPFAQGARHQQLEAVSKEDEAARKQAVGISPEEQQINRYMASGAIALGLSVDGYFMSPLTLLAAIPAFYSFLPVYPRAVKLLI
ncbi:MAG: hypothetical protein ACPGWR_03930 [Ardenticatenaceae bacterium]